MYTFSQMVDEMVSETKRPDLVSEISRYVNQTIREVHFTPDRNAALNFEENFREQQVNCTVESGQTWAIANPTIFQAMQGVLYPDVFDRNGRQVWADHTTPGRHLASLDHFYYRVGGTFTFAGYGGVGAVIALAYYEFPNGLKYKTEAQRPAWYDVESGWSYAPGVDTPELQEAARDLVTNWLLTRWSDVISEGARAKLYKRLSDTERARTCYSLYGSLRQGLWTSETAQFVGG